MAVMIQYQFIGIGFFHFCDIFNINGECSSDVMYMYSICIHFNFNFYRRIFLNHLKCHPVDYNTKTVPITYRSLSFNMHVYYKLLLFRNDLATLTDMMKFCNVVDIVSVCRKMKFQSHIYNHVHLKMVAGSTSSWRQKLLHDAKSTESTEPPAGCNLLI